MTRQSCAAGRGTRFVESDGAESPGMEAEMRDVVAEATQNGHAMRRPTDGTAHAIGSRLLGERVMAMARVAVALHMAAQTSGETEYGMSPVRRGSATLWPVGGADQQRAGHAVSRSPEASA